MLWGIVAAALAVLAAWTLLRWRLTARPVLRTTRGGRQMGLLERWYSASADSDTMLTFGICVQFRAGGQTAALQWWVSELEDVARDLYARHPSLTVSIVDDGGEGQPAAPVHNFVRLPTTTDVTRVVSVVSRMDDASWQEEMHRQQTLAFPPASPLFRLVLLHAGGTATGPQDVDVLVVVHHAVVDGRAAAYLATEVVRLVVADSIRARGTPRSGVACPDPLPPALDECMDLRPRLGTGLWAAAVDKLPALRRWEPTGWLGPSHHIPAKRRTGASVYGRIPASLMQQVREACAQRGVSVHAAFTAACVAACGGVQARLGLANPSVPFVIDSAVSLRPSHVPISRLGVYVTGMPVCAPLIAPFWSVAASAYAILHDPRKRADAATLIGLLSFLSGSWLAFFRRRCDLAPNGRTSSVTLSNLGSVAFPPSPPCAPVTFRTAWFGQEKPKEGGLFTVSLLTVEGGEEKGPCGNVALSVPVPVLTRADAATFLEEMQAALRKHCA